MDFIGQTQHFFTTTLPNTLLGTFYTFGSIMNETLGWIICILLIAVSIFTYFLYKKFMLLQHKEYRLNTLLLDAAQAQNVDELDKVFVSLIRWLDGDFYALYQLHSNTYVLVETNVNTQLKGAPAAASLHIKQNQIKDFSTSGNYTISSYQTQQKNYLIRFYAKQKIELMHYQGVIENLLARYRVLTSDDEQLTSLQLANTSKELLKIINGSHFGNNGYIKYVLSMIKRVIDAYKIEMKGKEKVYYTLGSLDSKVQSYEKIFYIRNTNFQVIIYTKNPLSQDQLIKLGSFLDLTGMFLSTLDEESSIASNYMEFLLEANTLLEKTEHKELHSKKVELVAVEIAKKLFLSKQEVEALSIAAKLHDIGSMQDLNDIDNEYFDDTQEHKLHPLIGAILIEPIGNIYPIASIIKYHHERLDGKGYPFGIKGNKIPILAQILGLSEYFIGLTSKRSEEMGMEHEGAVMLVQKSSNIMFDQVIVETFLNIHEDLEKKLMQLELKSQLQE